MSEAPEKILISNFHGTGINSTTDENWEFGTWCTEWEKSDQNVEYVRADLVDGLKDALSIISNIHDGNPSLAMADMPELDYARHMLFEARKLAKETLTQ